jgi:lipopolysaccharide export system permease protein
MQTLKYDIIVSKPAFDIKEGVFYDRIEGFVIKIGKKEKDGSTIRNVVIYEQNNNGQQDNMIVADSGTMVVTPDKQSLIFTLKSGWRYQEKGERNVYAGTELVRMGFKQYKKVMDLSSFRMNRTDDSTFKDNFQMLTILQLGHRIDSLRKINQKYIDQINQAPERLYQFPHYLDTTGWAAVEKGPLNDPHLLKYDWAKDSLTRLWTRDRKILDSTEKAQKAIAEAVRKAADSIKAAAKAAARNTPKPAATTKTGKDTTAIAKVVPKTPPPAPTNVPHTTTPNIPYITIAGAPVTKDPPQVRINDMIPDSIRLTVLNRTIDNSGEAKGESNIAYNLYSGQHHHLLENEMAWHEKITLAVACMVMFLIGAPLGSIIRKGGIGLPLVFAVVFFVIFFLLNNFGKKLAGSNVLTPANGLWLATYVLTPMGLFLVYKALHDSQLFNKEFYFRLTRKLRPLLARLAKKIRKASLRHSLVQSGRL